MEDRRILIIAGPNGAGKTTFATEFLPNEAHCPIFVNADLIAAGLSPFRPDLAAFRAGRLMLRQIHEHARRGDSFAFETTLSGLVYARWIPRNGRRMVTWSSCSTCVCPAPEAAIARVAQRVSEGGHDVPEPVIRRRFHAGRRNLELVYKGLVNKWAEYDNTGETPKLLAEGSLE